MKNKFFISIILLFFVSSCSISNPLKKKVKVTYLDCPKSLILFEARVLELGNANIELLNDYKLSCYLIEDKGVIEISTDYTLDLSILDEENRMYQVDLIIFITDKNQKTKINEYKFTKELKIDKEDQKSFIFNFDDKFQIDLKTFNEGIKLFYALN